MKDAAREFVEYSRGRDTEAKDTTDRTNEGVPGIFYVGMISQFSCFNINKDASHFKDQGGQYQTLINEVLRRYKDHFSGRRTG